MYIGAVQFSMSEYVVSLADIRKLALYQQFIVALLLGYAVLMAGVTVLFATSGDVAALVTGIVSLGIGAAALTIVPAVFSPDGGG